MHLKECDLYNIISALILCPLCLFLILSSHVLSHWLDSFAMHSLQPIFFWLWERSFGWVLEVGLLLAESLLEISCGSLCRLSNCTRYSSSAAHHPKITGGSRSFHMLQSSNRSNLISDASLQLSETSRPRLCLPWRLCSLSNLPIGGLLPKLSKARYFQICLLFLCCFWFSFNLMDLEGAFVWFFQFFTTKPFACDPSSLPKYPPSKEFDAKLRDEEARRYTRELN